MSNFDDFDPFIHRLDSSSFADEEQPLKQVNQYILVRKLGFGTFAKVYLAIDSITKEPFALKKFKLYNLQHLDAGISQLEREIRAIRQISHPNIIKLREVLHIESSNTVFLVINYCDCGSLQHVLDAASTHRLSMKSPSRGSVRYIFMKLLDAVAYLHSKGMVHQDIKPSNILLCSDAKVFLADFGLGHSFQSAANVVGSPAYQAPEALCEGEFEPETLNPAKEDVWSTGITLFQTLFGYLPFTGENFYEIVKNILQSELVFPEGTSDDVKELLRGMLAVNPAERWTVSQVLESTFFKDVKQIEHFDFEVNPIPSLSEIDKKVVKITAKVCDQNYSFAQPKLSAQQLLQNMSLDTDIDDETLAKYKPTTFC